MGKGAVADMFSITSTKEGRRQFEALALPLLDSLYAAALRLTRHEGDAEDLVQDTFMRAYRFFGRFEKGTHFKAWIFKILTNTFINKYRRQVKERSLEDESERSAVAAQFFSHQATDAAANPETHVFNRLTSVVVLQEIDKLPIDFRMVVILADLQEFSYREIAEMLEVPVGTVMSRLFRGRKLLQKALTADNGEGFATGNADPIDLAEFRSRKKLG